MDHHHHRRVIKNSSSKVVKKSTTAGNQKCHRACLIFQQNLLKFEKRAAALHRHQATQHQLQRNAHRISEHVHHMWQEMRFQQLYFTQIQKQSAAHSIYAHTLHPHIPLVHPMAPFTHGPAFSIGVPRGNISNNHIFIHYFHNGTVASYQSHATPCANNAGPIIQEVDEEDPNIVNENLRAIEYGKN